MNKLWQEYSLFEDELRRRFHEHRIYNFLKEIPDDKFRRYLLQIGFIAREFVKWYEVAKQGLTNEQAKEVVRTILRDEIPQQGPTHQDDRLYDLGLMGVSRDEVLNVQPTVFTSQVIHQLYHFVRSPQDYQDLRIMVTLRVAGEVLVSEQYSHIVGEMERRFGIKPEQSRFYAPHYMHDMKGGSAHEESAGHSDAFDELLSSMITDERTLKVAKEQAKMAAQARGGIHNQFLGFTRGMEAFKALSGVAVGVLLLMLGAGVIKGVGAQHDRERWTAFLSRLAPAARTFYLDCDQQLLERVQRTGDTSDLSKVGTSAACHEMW